MKTKFKKALLFSAVVMLLSVLLCFNASALDATGQCGENVTWSYNSETGELVISGTGEMENYDYYSPSPFSESDVKTVIIETGVTSIGDEIFEDCTSLIKVTIPDSVIAIGDYAFSYCTSLESIEIPNSVASIGEYAF